WKNPYAAAAVPFRPKPAGARPTDARPPGPLHGPAEKRPAVPAPRPGAAAPPGSAPRPRPAGTGSQRPPDPSGKRLHAQGRIGYAAEDIRLIQGLGARRRQPVFPRHVQPYRVFQRPLARFHDLVVSPEDAGIPFDETGLVPPVLLTLARHRQAGIPAQAAAQNGCS